MNGKVKTLGLGTMAGVVSAAVAFTLLNITMVDRFRGQGVEAAALESRVLATETWISDYDRYVRPLRDQFIKFTGQLPWMINEMENLWLEIRRLSDRLDALEKKRPAVFTETGR